MKSIIFLHKGSAYYLSIAVAQAKKTNPNVEIILLGDKLNENVYGCKHYHLTNYFKEAGYFAKKFVNYSPNPKDYELFCFQRWFVIKELLKSNPEYDDGFLYCDSDTMLFSNIISDIENLGRAPLAIESEESPGFTFFNKGTLDEFCSLLMWLYDSPKEKEVICRKYEELVNIKARQGISDMTAFKFYCKHVRPGEVIAAEHPKLQTFYGGKIYSCYDHNVNISNNFRMKNGMKEFEWRNGFPFAYSFEVNDFVFLKVFIFKVLRNIR